MILAQEALAWGAEAFFYVAIVGALFGVLGCVLAIARASTGWTISCCVLAVMMTMIVELWLFGIHYRDLGDFWDSVLRHPLFFVLDILPFLLGVTGLVIWSFRRRPKRTS